MTKIVTATAAVSLAGVGALDLDAPVTEYFPPFAKVRQPRPVTVRHLLSHCSGLANPLPIRWVRAAGVPAPDSAAFVGRLPAGHRRLRFVPGMRARYSNLGYLVLGEVIAAATGTPFEQIRRLQPVLRPRRRIRRARRRRQRILERHPPLPGHRVRRGRDGQHDPLRPRSDHRRRETNRPLTERSQRGR